MEALYSKVMEKELRVNRRTCPNIFHWVQKDIDSSSGNLHPEITYAVTCEITLAGRKSEVDGQQHVQKEKLYTRRRGESVKL